MFDLVDILKSNQSQQDDKDKITSVLFYQTEPCRSLVEEAFRFEGVSAPEICKNSDMVITDHVRQQSVEIVLVELNSSQDVTGDARRISHLLPSHASVIVIGSEDAISTIRNLKEMGFYYLFWPITKQELIDFVRSVSDNRQRNRGVGQNRRAKRISVVGAKGGVGTTLVASELAHQLVSEKKASCIVVDHNYTSGDLDIMLGIKKFEKREVQKGAFSSSLDLSSAQSLLTKHNEMLSVLALSSSQYSADELNDYHNSAADILSSECNFIIEDVSGSSGFTHRNQQRWLSSDCIILVLTPTVAALRDAGRLKLSIDSMDENARPRLILVVNNNFPGKFATVTEDDIEKFLQCAVDVNIPFNGKIGELLLEGERIARAKVNASGPLHKLASLVVGESVEASSTLAKLTNLFSRKRQAE
ncbi:AAA family ATPase [Salinivibrio sharmensis]|uniref:Chromosome partitioning protein ParA n=1 Tax=Salinivibrio sharmensis TaxID=390883 RepID=A0ABX3K9C8_9GAMM|nr:chromosome partitioning protein ParA [Salinivibrio sharmensis]OOE85478.1 chromosome partitioning protein ParA [Salinivibrio sharmensis]